MKKWFKFKKILSSFLFPLLDNGIHLPWDFNRSLSISLHFYSYHIWFVTTSMLIPFQKFFYALSSYCRLGSHQLSKLVLAGFFCKGLDSILGFIGHIKYFFNFPFFFLFNNPFKNVRIILSLQAIQKQAASSLWAGYCKCARLLTSGLGYCNNFLIGLFVTCILPHPPPSSTLLPEGSLWNTNMSLVGKTLYMFLLAKFSCLRHSYITCGIFTVSSWPSILLGIQYFYWFLFLKENLYFEWKISIDCHN